MVVMLPFSKMHCLLPRVAKDILELNMWLFVSRLDARGSGSGEYKTMKLVYGQFAPRS